MSRWGTTDADVAREKRNGRILELWAMGWNTRAIAEVTGLTSQRVSQVVLSFGIRERTRRV